MMWGITLDRHSELPLKRQLYLAFRDRITAGQLQAGDAVLSTRELAAALGISRNTVARLMRCSSRKATSSAGRAPRRLWRMA